MSDFEKQLESYTATVNAALDRCVPESDRDIDRSMRYSVMAGGKRIRPVLTLTACKTLGGDPEHALPFACALELIHTYSLIYDDLPCMDNDVLRRGKPTNHVVFGEAIALMAGMGLYARAFETVLAAPELTADQCRAGMRVLADASGMNGIVLGQVLDIDNVAGKALDLEALETIHRLKTSAMLEASVRLGAIAAGADPETLVPYAKAIGLAFQIRDDILDVIGSTEDMGKSVGKDDRSEKTTFAGLLGVERAQARVDELTRQAKQSLDGFDGEFLCALADFLCGRTH